MAGHIMINVFYCICLLLFCQDIISAMIMHGKTSTDIDSAVGLLIKENEILRNRIERLEAGREQLDNRVDIIEELTNQLLELKEHAEAIKSKRSAISFQKSEQSVRSDENPDILKLLNGTLASFLCSGSTVAFYSYVSSDRCYNNRETIIFDREVLDVKHAYNSNSGIFVVPISGIYVFSWTVAAPQDNWFFAELVVNDQVAGAIMTDADVGGRAQGVHPATGVAVLMVEANTHVFIRFNKGHNCVLTSNYRVKSTFSGWLIQHS